MEIRKRSLNCHRQLLPGHGPIHVSFEFENPVKLSSLVIQLFEQCSNRSVKLSISEDGQTWRPIASASCRRGHVPAGREELIEGFRSRESRFAKLEFTGSHSREATRLYELEFPVGTFAKNSRQSGAWQCASGSVEPVQTKYSPRGTDYTGFDY